MPNRDNVFLKAVPLSQFAVKPIEWLWPGHFPLGKLSILSGDPDLGKSLLTVELAARISSDRDWPDGSPAPRGARAMLLAAEDGVGDTIRPRLEAAGGKPDRADILTATTETGGDCLISLERDVEAIDRLAANGDYRLIVIDPITEYLEGADMNRQQDVRGVLHRLGAVAERSRAAIVLVNHHRKAGEKGPAVYRTLGAIAFAAVARAVWNVVKDPADPQRRLMVPVKMNLARKPPARAFRVYEPGLLEWEPDAIDLSADEVSLEALAETDADDRVRAAKVWLHNYLDAGPRPANEVKSAAKQAGIARDPLWAAKKALKIAAAHVKKEGRRYYEWRLLRDDVMTEEEHNMLLFPLTTGQMVRKLKELRREDRLDLPAVPRVPDL